MKNTAEYLAKKIEDLGYTLVVKHNRYDKYIDRGVTVDSSRFSIYGGYTVATICDNEGWIVCIGKSKCSFNDNFQKKMGWVKAVGRAYSKIPST